MCLILIKDRGTKMKDGFFEILQKAFFSNHDGAAVGLKRSRNNGVVSNRGLMTVNSLLEMVERLQVNTEDTLVVHLRMGTQGANDEYNTHGFVIGDSEKENLLAGSFYDTTLLYHNGWFTDPLSKPQTKDEKDFSDTRLVTKKLFNSKVDSKTFADYLYDLRKTIATQTEFNCTVAKNFPTINHQKIALLNGNNGLLTMGNFVTDTNGFMHSHGGYIKQFNRAY